MPDLTRGSGSAERHPDTPSDALALILAHRPPPGEPPPGLLRREGLDYGPHDWWAERRRVLLAHHIKRPVRNALVALGLLRRR